MDNAGAQAEDEEPSVPYSAPQQPPPTQPAPTHNTDARTRGGRREGDDHPQPRTASRGPHQNVFAPAPVALPVPPPEDPLLMRMLRFGASVMRVPVNEDDGEARIRPAGGDAVPAPQRQTPAPAADPVAFGLLLRQSGTAAPEPAPQSAQPALLKPQVPAAMAPAAKPAAPESKPGEKAAPEAPLVDGEATAPPAHDVAPLPAAAATAARFVPAPAAVAPPPSPGIHSPAAPSAPPADPVASVEAAAPPLPAPVAARPVHDVSLRLSAAGENVAVRVTERAGQVQVVVRSSDGDLTHGLRTQLPDLVRRLDSHGFVSEVWRPSESAHANPDGNQPGGQPDTSGQQQGGRQNRHPQTQDEDFQSLLSRDDSARRSHT